MTVINSNSSALRAQNASASANMALNTAMQRLSTGKRINTAADDAAGYAIASKMVSTERGMAVAIRNANDGISLAQTAGSALDSVTSMLQRMQELATESANGTLGTSERASLQSEATQLVSQINNIAKTTNFNGINLLDGSLKNLTLQIGTGGTDKVSLSVGTATAAALGLTAVQGVSSGRVSGTTAIVAGDLKFNGINAFDPTSTAANLSAGKFTPPGTDNAQALATAINANTDRTGVQATAYNAVTTNAVTGPFKSGDLKINGTAVGAAADAQGLVDNINKGSFGVTAALNSDGSITLANQTGEDIDLTGSNSAGASTDLLTAAGASNSGYVSFSSTDGSAFTVANGTTTSAYVANSNSSGVTGSAASGSAVNWASGDVVINGVNIGAATGSATKPTAGSAYAAAINAVSSQTGVYATADATTGALTLSSATGGNITVEGNSAALTAAGLIAQGNSNAQSNTLDISTQASASGALATIQTALDKVTSLAGNLGALQNRMQVTVDNLTASSANLESARSRIQDADFSAETTNLAKAQILSQASTAMLAQANQSQQGVLKLLQ